MPAPIVSNARAWWRAVHRWNRVMRRENAKAMQDMFMYGVGAVMLPEGTDPYHVAAKKIFDQRKDVFRCWPFE